MPPTEDSEQQRLMAAIIALPDDDAPREAYARACEVQDPDRARLIRIQVEEMSKYEKTHTFRYHSRNAEIERLVDLYGIRWAGEWSAWLPARNKDTSRHEPLVCDHGYVRGFIEYLAMNPVDLLAHGERIKLDTPLRHLDLIGSANDEAIREVLAGPLLAGIRSLRITDHSITDEHIADLVRSPHVTTLRWLVMDADRITLHGIESLASSRHLSGLRYFESKAVSIADHNYSYDGIGNWPVYWDFTPECVMLEKRYGYLPWAHLGDHWWKEKLDVRIMGAKKEW